MNSKIKAIAKRIKAYDTIVLARHIGPDPDAIASQIAFRDAIKLRYPSKKVYAVGASVAKFKHFGTLDKVKEEELSKALVFVLDCPNKARIDGIDIDKCKEVIKIDHHPFMDRMGIIEWVDTKYTSVCEMITEFLISARYRANKTIAENLFLGVVSDSDRFLFSTTTYKTFELMAILIKNSKINVSELYPRLYLRPINEVRFQSYITEHLNVTKNGFASLKITKKVLEKYGVDVGTPSNLVNNFNNIEEVLCWALVTYDEKQSLYKVNIRSRGPIINTVAEKFNGGGHKLASGAKIKSALDVDKILRQLDEACALYRTSKGIKPIEVEEIKEEKEKPKTEKEDKKEEKTETIKEEVKEKEEKKKEIKEEKKEKKESPVKKNNSKTKSKPKSKTTKKKVTKRKKK